MTYFICLVEQRGLSGTKKTFSRLPLTKCEQLYSNLNIKGLAHMQKFKSVTLLQVGTL